MPMPFRLLKNLEFRFLFLFLLQCLQECGEQDMGLECYVFLINFYDKNARLYIRGYDFCSGHLIAR